MTRDKDAIELLKRIRNDLPTKEVMRELYDAVIKLPILLEQFENHAHSNEAAVGIVQLT